MVRDIVTNDRVASYTGHTSWVLDLDINNTDSQVASGGFDWTARVWDAFTGADFLRFAGHDGPVYHVQFSPDSTRLLTVDVGGTARVWDISDIGGREVFADQVPTTAQLANGIPALAFLGNSSRLLVHGVGNAGPETILYDIKTGENERIQHRSAESMAVSPLGDAIALTHGNVINIFEPDAAGPPEIYRTSDASVDDSDFTAYSPNGRTIAFGSRPGSGLESTTAQRWHVGVLDLESRAITTVVDDGGDLVGLSFDTDGTLIAVFGDGTVSVWDLQTPESPLFEFELGIEVQVAAVADGVIVFADHLGSWLSASIESGVRLEEPHFAHVGGITAISFNPRKREMATAGDDGSIKIWDLDTGEPRMTITSADGPIVSLAYNHDGSWLAASSENGLVRVYTLDPDELIRIGEWRLPAGVELTDDECSQYLHIDSCDDR